MRLRPLRGINTGRQGAFRKHEDGLRAVDVSESSALERMWAYVTDCLLYVFLGTNLNNENEHFPVITTITASGAVYRKSFTSERWWWRNMVSLYRIYCHTATGTLMTMKTLFTTHLLIVNGSDRSSDLNQTSAASQLWSNYSMLSTDVHSHGVFIRQQHVYLVPALQQRVCGADANDDAKG